MDQLVATTNALGHTWYNFYDAEGRTTAKLDALGHAEWFGHDAAGQLVAHTNALGFATFYGYGHSHLDAKKTPAQSQRCLRM